ncbi:outer membrane protein [Bradyrhizobium lablabi]|uniref:outer membrane protein n=1 Tax=Bradyrhizobium lablabi TaxID=722472 RepID=UPI001BA6F021|nr:outer membrane beta-barrel protein [Bradyrhizobium lablabi]MBR0697516.1 porin family protein [Bradyrhizobium lablabi]
MKKVLFATASLIALGTTAPTFAADLAARPYTKAPPVIATVYNWSGFYIGINGGWGQSHDNRIFDPTGASFGSHDADGGTVGGQIGYRWQTGGWVFGLEAQGNWADFSGNSGNAFAPGNVVRSKTDAFGLFTGQIGYAWNNALFYVKGGAAVTDRNYQFVTAGALVSESGFDTRWGGTVGAGLEFGFAPNWSLGIEYDHIFEDRHGVTFISPAGFATTGFSSGGDTDLVTARLNYRFSGPTLARY